MPPPLTGGVHPQIPGRGEQDFSITGGHIVVGDKGPKFVPLQKRLSNEKCIVDYATITFAEQAISRFSREKPFTDDEMAEVTARYFLDCILRTSADVLPEKRGGVQGYRAGVKMGEFGLVATGGQNGSVMVSIYGHAFSVCDSGMAGRLAQFIEAIPSAHLTRIDLAYDDLDGKLFPVRGVRSMWENGEFTSGNAPVKPKLEFRGDYERNDPDDLGITAYLWSTGSGKKARIYEKGKQLGDKSSPWVRVEVQLSNSVYQLVPAMLLKPTGYFVMLCPAFACIAYDGELTKTERIGKEALITVERVIEIIRTQYGAYLHTLRKEFFGTDQELLDAICRTGKTPKVLDRALKLSDTALNADAGHVLQAEKQEQ